MGGVCYLDSYTADIRGPCREEKASKRVPRNGSAKVIFEGFLEAAAQTQQVSRSSESTPEITRSFCLTRQTLCRSSAVPDIQAALLIVKASKTDVKNPPGKTYIPNPLHTTLESRQPYTARLS